MCIRDRDEGDSWQPGPSTPNPPVPRAAAGRTRASESLGASKGSASRSSGGSWLRTSRVLRRSIICGGVLAIVALGATAYRYIADGGDGLHSKRLDVEFELDDDDALDRPRSASSFGGSPERIAGGSSLSRLAHPNAGAYRSPAERDAALDGSVVRVVEEERDDDDDLSLIHI